MKAETQIEMCKTGVLRKLWSNLKRKKHTPTIKITIEVECGEEVENSSLQVDVDCQNKIELIDAIAASAKLTKADAGRSVNGLFKTLVILRDFKAQEPEL